MELNLCKYKNIFGEPGTGVHKYRIFDIAVVDTVLTVLIIALIIWVWYKKFSTVKTRKHVGWVVLFTTIIVFSLGIFAHRLFCVNTTINKKLFGIC